MSYDNYNFGIVIDSGSSGSRIQIYKWERQDIVRKNSNDHSVLSSPPKIEQEPNWTLKISPGISTYNDPTKVKEIWSDHFSGMMKFAQEIIPQNKHHETPVFVLATAGMRLQTPTNQEMILKEICSSLKKNTDFLISKCEDFVHIIDGETEGIYGWLGLNYLLGQFNNYDSSQSSHNSVGFMDMGGASTQIAFVPSSIEEIERHRDDLSSVTLRNINGEMQEWKVFVETWLGFGANEARKRYLNQLINISFINEKVGNNINDPCLPINAELNYEYEGRTYIIKGIGNYKMCLKTIYPLLLKNVPCTDSPCLFNGVHGPKLNFDKDKFVGISEYWYTANDIFQSGGEYNYHSFNKKVQEYCESDWSQILKNSEEGKYSNLDPDKFLKDSCFKASWVINVLHEGFELPRLGIEFQDESSEDNENAIKEIENTHIPFKSADSVNGEELSWTLGKILQFASSQIETSDNFIESKPNIGIYPSEISGKKFVSGGIVELENDYSKDGISEKNHKSRFCLFLFALCVIIFLIYRLSIRGFGKSMHRLQKFGIPSSFKRNSLSLLANVPYVKKFARNSIICREYQDRDEMNISLEEGLLTEASSNKDSSNDTRSSVLRTRSAINIYDQSNQDNFNEDPTNLRSPPVFFNKPFISQNKSLTNLFSQPNNSKEVLNKMGSITSSPRI